MTIEFGTLVDLAGIVTSIASLIIATVALFLSRSQIVSQRKSANERLAKEAVDTFFSFELAEVRFRIFDNIARACDLAGREAPSRDQKRMFPVTVDSTEMPSRFEILEYWKKYPPTSEGEEDFRDTFEKDTAILMSTFDMIFRAAAENTDAAKHVQQRMGRLLVWWILLWPKIFDHTNSFMGRKFVNSPELDKIDPSKKNEKYTALWYKAPLWDHEQWLGAIENYLTIEAVMMPKSRFKKGCQNEDKL